MKRAVLELPDGREAILTPKGWHVSPPDPVLEKRLREDFDLGRAQRMTRTRCPPDPLEFTARAAAFALGAEDPWIEILGEPIAE